MDRPTMKLPPSSSYDMDYTISRFDGFHRFVRSSTVDLQLRSEALEDGFCDHIKPEYWVLRHLCHEWPFSFLPDNG